MRGTRRNLTALVMLATLTPLVAFFHSAPLRALSCEGISPSEAIFGADVAFIGEPVAWGDIERIDPTTGIDRAVTFKVNRVLDAEIGTEVTVWTNASEAYSGAPYPWAHPRDGTYEVAVVAFERDGRLVASSNCMPWIAAADMDRIVTGETPASSGTGTMRALITTQTGWATVGALDGEGAFLGWGGAGVSIDEITACPDAAVAVEISGAELAIRDLATMERVGGAPLATDLGAETHCLSGIRPDAAVLLHLTNGFHPRNATSVTLTVNGEPTLQRSLGDGLAVFDQPHQRVLVLPSDTDPIGAVSLEDLESRPIEAPPRQPALRADIVGDRLVTVFAEADQITEPANVQAGVDIYRVGPDQLELTSSIELDLGPARVEDVLVWRDKTVLMLKHPDRNEAVVLADDGTVVGEHPLGDRRPQRDGAIVIGDLLYSTRTVAQATEVIDLRDGSLHIIETPGWSRTVVTAVPIAPANTTSAEPLQLVVVSEPSPDLVTSIPARTPAAQRADDAAFPTGWLIAGAVVALAGIGGVAAVARSR